MKHKASLLIVAIFACLGGVAIERLHQSVQHTQQSSSAGQTLVDLSKALDEEKRKSGEYPDSISDLKVHSDFGDFSKEILKEIKYFKTETGYIAFTGRPKVAYIYPGVSTQYE
jgi:type II secretory pathway pseudopilin PulG